MLLAGSVSEPVALVAALVSWLLMTVADLAWPAVALLTDRRRKRKWSTHPTSTPFRAVRRALIVRFAAVGYATAVRWLA